MRAVELQQRPELQVGARKSQTDGNDANADANRGDATQHPSAQAAGENRVADQNRTRNIQLGKPALLPLN